MRSPHGHRNSRDGAAAASVRYANVHRILPGCAGVRGRDHFQAWSSELRLGPAPAEWHGVDAKHGLRRRLPAAEPDRARIAAHDDTAIFFGCPDVDAAYAHLRSRA